MGGDYAPGATVHGASLAKEALGDKASIVLIGDREKAESILVEKGGDPKHFEFAHAPEVIEMGAHPTKAFNKKPNSSIVQGFRLLKEGNIDAFAGAGNTGAMLVGSFYSVKTIHGVIRPCITSSFPKEDGGANILLDVGINSDCKPDVLYQFGILGSLYAEHVHGISKPRVALLNIGEEAGKGNLITQAAYDLMKDTEDFHFVGNIESRDLFGDRADVIVCDGFTGNVMLKQAEAFYTLFQKRQIKDSYFDRFNYESYGGTPILGINANVIIGHGISNEIAIKNMILSAYEVAEARLSEKIKQAFV